MAEGKIVSIEERIPKLKKMRRRKANKRLIFLLSFFFLLIICIMYFISPLSYIQHLNVKGNRYISTDKIIEASGLTKDTGMWSFDKEEISKKIKENPEIKEVTITRKFPNSVSIAVDENNRLGYLVKGSSFLPILENGELLEALSNDAAPISAPILIGFSKGKELNLLLKELGNLPAEINNSISEIHFDPKKTDQYHIRIYMNDGFEVRASGRTLADNLVHYPSLVGQLDPEVKGVIDMEVGSYFSPYEAPENTKSKEETEKEAEASEG